jgi:hypothetical protein
VVEVTQLALIPPVSMLDYTKLTSYQLALPHLMNTNHRYRRHYGHMADSTEHFIILDNGEAEGENKYTPRQLLDMATRYNFDEVVAKDVMGNMLATVESTKEFLNVYKTYSHRNEVRVGIVAQGHSKSQVLAFIQYFANEPWTEDLFKTIYLPRHLIGTLGVRGRVELAQAISKMGIAKKYDIHFLGAHHDAPAELTSVVQTVPWVRGFDTSMPFNYAYANSALGEGHHKRPDNYFDLQEKDFTNPHQVHTNVMTMIRWAKTPPLVTLVGPGKEY